MLQTMEDITAICHRQYVSRSLT